MFERLRRTASAVNRAVTSGEGWYAAWQAAKQEFGLTISANIVGMVTGILGFVSTLAADISWAGISVLAFCAFVAGRQFVLQGGDGLPRSPGPVSPVEHDSFAQPAVAAPYVETPEERGAKHDLAAFLTDHALPAFALVQNRVRAGSHGLRQKHQRLWPLLFQVKELTQGSNVRTRLHYLLQARQDFDITSQASLESMIMQLRDVYSKLVFIYHIIDKELTNPEMFILESGHPWKQDRDSDEIAESRASVEAEFRKITSHHKFRVLYDPSGRKTFADGRKELDG